MGHLITIVFRMVTWLVLMLLLVFVMWFSQSGEFWPSIKALEIIRDRSAQVELLEKLDRPFR